MNDSRPDSGRHSRRHKKRRAEYQAPNPVDALQVLAKEATPSVARHSRTRTKHRCPHCISDYLCLSRRMTLLDKLTRLIGLKALRCEHCYKRYYRF